MCIHVHIQMYIDEKTHSDIRHTDRQTDEHHEYMNISIHTHMHTHMHALIHTYIALACTCAW